MSRTQTSAIALLLLSPLLVTLALLVIVPAIQLFWISLTDLSPGLVPNFVGLDNYVRTATDPRFIAALVRNLGFVVVVVGLQVVIGFCIALLIEEAIPLRSVWFAVILSPFAVSPIVAVVMWKYVLDPTFGIVNYAITRIGLPAVPWMVDANTSMAVIVIVAVWKDFAFVTIAIYAALTAVPRDLYEASRVDGATPLQNLIFVKIPMITPAISVVLLFRVIFTLREFGVPWTLTGGGPGTSTEILAIYLYKQAFRYSDFGGGAAVGWLMLLVTIFFSSFLIRRTYRGMFAGNL